MPQTLDLNLTFQVVGGVEGGWGWWSKACVAVAVLVCLVLSGVNEHDNTLQRYYHVHSSQTRQDTPRSVFEVVLQMWMERERHFQAWRPRTLSPPPPFVVGVTCTFPLLETVARWCAEREPHRLTLIPRNHVYICVIPSFCSCFVILCLLASCSPPLLSFGLFIVSCLLWSRCYQRIQETIKGENKRQEDE